jgi:hypothetical protein
MYKVEGSLLFIRGEVLYNILIEFDIHMKLFKLIKVCFDENMLVRIYVMHFLFRMIWNKEILLSALLFNFISEYSSKND